jgi:hypothetical protein
MLKNTSLLLAFLLCTIHILHAQPDIELAEEQKKHPDDFLIYTSKNKDIDISLKNGKLYITSDVYDELFILKNLASLDAEESVDYSIFYKLLSLEAYTLVPNGKTYKKVEVKDFKERHVFDNMVFHDDVNERVFTYPNLSKGAKKVLHYKQEFTEPQLLDGFFFASSLFTNTAKLTITVDENIDLGFKLFNGEGYAIVAKVEKVKNRKVYTWQIDNAPKVKFENNVYSPRYYIPHILYNIKSYTVDGKSINVLSNIDDLHTYYTRFLKDLNLDNNPALKQVADSITSGITDESEKIKKIYYWVKDNIRYIAFEDGFGGFIPRDATEVCDKKFGDCKDMANLLVSMIRSIGIKNVYHTWIGSNSLPYRYEDIPSTAVDNHMIATYIKDGEYIYLDATSKYTPWGYPSEFIQNKEALIHLDDKTYEIKKIPEVPCEKNEESTIVNIFLKGDSIIGHGNTTVIGYTKDYFLEMFSDYTGEQRMKNIKPYLELGNNKFYLKDFTEQNIKDRDKNYIIDFNFELNNYGIDVEDKKYINLYLDKYYDQGKIDTSRTYDLQNRFADLKKLNITLNIPEGYTVSYIPKNVQLENNLLKFRSEFTKLDNKVNLTYSIGLKKLIIKKEELDDWNKIIEQLQDAYSENISLTKIK